MRKKIAIVASYFSGENYGLLGPQLAATIIQEHTRYDCIVVAVTNEDHLPMLRSALSDYFGTQRPVVGFSLLSGRENLFSFAKTLKQEGALTILAGPQADADYRGESGWPDFPHRFHGLSDHFSLALNGPAEQVIHLLDEMDRGGNWKKIPGVLYKEEDNAIEGNPRKPWEWTYFNVVRWDNLYVMANDVLRRHSIKTAQVLQQLGCPHAARTQHVGIDYPSAILQRKGEKIFVDVKGCSFCDVAADKGFCGTLDDESVMNQIRCLPEDGDGRKIPFELINENPLSTLPRLLRRLREEHLQITQINLTMRADWFLAGEKRLRESLQLVSEMEARILMASMGLEAFDGNLLKNFNKGYTVQTNIDAIRLMRDLKEAFPQAWLYSNREGAIHGYIHPTPWDTRESFANTHKVIGLYGLTNDILPPNSTPLIIHHASSLGDWIRGVEVQEGLQYKRYGSIIGWWDEGRNFKKVAMPNF
jgi:hypothetical protein